MRTTKKIFNWIATEIWFLTKFIFWVIVALGATYLIFLLDSYLTRGDIIF